LIRLLLTDVPLFDCDCSTRIVCVLPAGQGRMVQVKVSIGTQVNPWS
jgi:hypothetical protein